MFDAVDGELNKQFSINYETGIEIFIWKVEILHVLHHLLSTIEYQLLPLYTIYSLAIDTLQAEINIFWKIIDKASWRDKKENTTFISSIIIIIIGEVQTFPWLNLYTYTDLSHYSSNSSMWKDIFVHEKNQVLFNEYNGR